MSVNLLTSPNSLDLFCDSLTANNINGGTISLSGAVMDTLTVTGQTNVATVSGTLEVGIAPGPNPGVPGIISYNDFSVLGNASIFGNTTTTGPITSSSTVTCRNLDSQEAVAFDGNGQVIAANYLSGPNGATVNLTGPVGVPQGTNPFSYTSNEEAGASGTGIFNIIDTSTNIALTNANAVLSLSMPNGNSSDPTVGTNFIVCSNPTATPTEPFKVGCGGQVRCVLTSGMPVSAVGIDNLGFLCFHP